MADATTTAKDRIDRALATLERKVLDLKARPASAPAVGDDDLFASSGVDEASAARVVQLETAAADASQALARAAEDVRAILNGEG